MNEIAAPAPEDTPESQLSTSALPERRVGLLRRVGRSAASWLRNPIVLKELRGRMRGWRAPVVMTVQLIVMSCFVSLIYFAVVEGTQSSGSGSIGQMLGQTLFYSTYMLLLVLVVFLSPAFTAGTISGERERKTLDLLITTLLSARSLVLGKLVSALAYIVLLILVALPIQSLALMFGGVVFSEMVVGTLILLVTALAAGSIGVLVSSLMRSSIASTVLTYAAILLFAIGLPVVVLIMTGFLSTVLERVFDDLNWAILAMLIYVGGFLLCTNPFATAVATKLVEDEENTLFFFTTQLPDAQGNLHTIPLISPWIVYILFYTALSALLIAASILILRHKRG